MDPPVDDGVGATVVGPLVVGQLVIDARDPDGLAAWWRQLIGGEVQADDDGDVRLRSNTAALNCLCSARRVDRISPGFE